MLPVRVSRKILRPVGAICRKPQLLRHVEQERIDSFYLVGIEYIQPLQE